MMTIPEDLVVGEHVYVSFSNGKEQKKEKHHESEYKVLEKTDRYIRIGSTSGDFSMFLGKSEIENLNGNVRRS